ncbi:MAG TPA: phosphoribosylaminoimidazolesuccinocarboxamide synthase [Candidatus Limnocylindrales bacterium]|nr:phosphoribosylaminoimidazolesuccinocarboxamide synthase [Candidatus Limnocylindrales bacterium]
MIAASYLRSGKVRDLYAVGEDRLLLVASDRISAFDVILPTAIPDKGRVLTGLSRFWFEQTQGIVGNHLVGTDPAAVPPGTVPADLEADLRGRMLLCRRATVLPVEIVVRGYLAGSGWKAYRADGSICGVALPSGLREGDRLPEPILTPATKAEAGHHDENIDFGRMVDEIAPVAIGDPRRLAEQVREIALELYRAAAERCAGAGIILADTKFEMGLVDDRLILVDEVLTPDSSRFWDAATWAPGGPQASYDKQFVRDWLERQPWDKTAPGPDLPGDVVAGTRARYVEAYERITGASFDRYLREDVVG